MLPKIRTSISQSVLILAVCLSTYAQRNGPPPSFTNERFVVLAMAALNRAEVTYRSTTGTGSFGSLSQLRSAGLIDEVLASGSKYGYVFAVNADQSTYTATALPFRYGKDGRYSYYIDQQGILLGGDRLGFPTGPADGVYVDTCALWGLADNERCTILAMRTLLSAETTYAATVGNGNFASLQQLSIAGLINNILGTGADHRYYFHIEIGSEPAAFRIWARPKEYAATGRRSFYTDQSGVVRGADHGGKDAGPNDPPVNE